MRGKRPETLGGLGRAPARASKQVVSVSPPPPPPPDKSPIRHYLHDAIFDNVGLKFLSLVLAITVFLLVSTDRDREITVRVPVEYTPLTGDKVLVSERLDEVRVTIKGPVRRLRNFSELEIHSINLDLRHASSGDVAITPDMIELPAGMTVTSITPRSVHVVFDRRIEKVVEVAPSLVGRPQHGYVVGEVKPIPATIKVRGAEGALAALVTVRTRDITIEGTTEAFTAKTEAVTPDGVEPVGSSDIVLHIPIDEELVTRKLPGLVVVARGDGVDPAKWNISPAQVEVTLTGALLAVEKAKPTLVPVVKPSGNDTKPREAAVSVEGLPPGVGVRISPERVKLAPAHAP